MKILRERRGFTTNSSSTSEWSSTTPASGTASTTPPKPTPAAPNGSDIPIGTELSFSPVAEPVAASQTNILPQGSANALAIMGVACAVGGIILGEKLVRGWLRRRKNDNL